MARRGWRPGDGLTCVHAKKAPRELPCGRPVITEITPTNSVGKRGFQVNRALCAQHAGIDPAPGQVMTAARKIAVERLCAEHWADYCQYLNEAIAEVKEQMRDRDEPAEVTRG